MERHFQVNLRFTNEFLIELDNGCIGVGSAPKGETPGIYEQDRGGYLQMVIDTMLGGGCVNSTMGRAADSFEQAFEQALCTMNSRKCAGLKLRVEAVTIQRRNCSLFGRVVRPENSSVQ